MAKVAGREALLERLAGKGPLLAAMQRVTMVDTEGGLEVRGLSLRPLEAEIRLKFRGSALGLPQSVTLPGSLWGEALERPVREVALEGKEVRFGGEGFRFALTPLAPEEEVEFALLQGAAPGQAVQGEGASFVQALLAVRHAAERGERSGSYLQGVAVDLGEGTLEVAATDGYRLAHVRLRGSGGLIRGRYLLPLKGVDLLVRALGKGDVPLVVEPHKGHMRFAWEEEGLEVELALPLMEGSAFPDYLPLLNPLPGSLAFPFPTGEALRVLQTLEFLADPGRPVATLWEEEGELLVRVEGPFGRGERRMTVPAPKGFQVRLYLPFLLDALRFFEGKEVLFHHPLGRHPVILRREEGAVYTAVLSPVI